MRWWIGNLMLDEDMCDLRRGVDTVPAPPQVVRLCLHLARNTHRVVARAELLDALWPSTRVGRNSLSQVVLQTRRCLGESRSALQTVRGFGYRLLCGRPRS